jgi:hypothetical protein
MNRRNAAATAGRAIPFVLLMALGAANGLVLGRSLGSTIMIDRNSYFDESKRK